MHQCGHLKAGFYPIPPRAVETIAARLRAPAGPWTLLDPCAGEGAAVGQLADLLGCDPKRVHAIELEAGRAAAVRARLPQGKVLAPASFLDCDATKDSFSCVYLNPPFDDSYGGGRVEGEFLSKATEWLRPGGVLVLVCPERVVEAWSVEYQLARWYHDLTVLPFPDDCRQYGEVAVIARKNLNENARYYSTKLGELRAADGAAYAIPEGQTPRRFLKVKLTEGEVRGLFADSPLRRRYRATGARRPKPLAAPPLALGAGHVGLLVAAGHLDGVVAPAGRRPHVVRGTSRKRTEKRVEEVEDSKGNAVTRTVLTEKIELVVRAVGPDGTLTTYSDAPPAPAPGAGAAKEACRG